MHPEKCPGVPSLLRPWLPHALCRTCALMAHLYAPATMKPAMERKSNHFECSNRINESTPGEANQFLVVEGLTAVDTPGTQSEARDSANCGGLLSPKQKECYR